MKQLIFACALVVFVLSGCSGWTVEPLPYISPSPLPSSTPVILSPTPIILPPPITATANGASASLTAVLTASLSASFTPTGTVTQTTTTTSTLAPTTAVPLTFTPTFTPTPFVAVGTKILGCNTAVDITHGMGEVTNAYVTIQNIGKVDLTNLCATLSSQDEGRPHPDKTKCVASLPAGYQVSEKLTVDSTLEKSSSIQVDVTVGNTLLQRVAQNACTDVDLLPPNMGHLGTIMPIPTP